MIVICIFACHFAKVDKTFVLIVCMTSAVALLTEMVRNETKYEKLHTTYLLKANIGKKVLGPAADGQGRSDHLKHKHFFFWPKQNH